MRRDTATSNQMDQTRLRSGEVLRTRSTSSTIGCAKAGVLSAQRGEGQSIGRPFVLAGVQCLSDSGGCVPGREGSAGCDSLQAAAGQSGECRSSGLLRGEEGGGSSARAAL